MKKPTYPKYKEAAEIVRHLRRIGWAMDSCGDASIVYSPDRKQFGLSQFMPDGPLVTVCDACFRTCCWDGILYCEDFDVAGTIDLPRNVLRLLDLEHEDYFNGE